jgi:hypothetical protein
VRLTPRWIGRRCGLAAASPQISGRIRKLPLHPAFVRLASAVTVAALLASLGLAQQGPDGFAGASVSVRFAERADATTAAGIVFQDFPVQSVTASASASLIFQNADRDYRDSRSYTIAFGEDSDSDFVPDSRDLCLGTALDTDIDENGCAQRQVDQDLDGVCNPSASSPRWCTGSDNCPTVANPDQRDTNGNGIGDVCEAVLQPPPSITSIAPTSGIQGATISLLTVTGTNFQATATLAFGGTGITIDNYVLRGVTSIIASISIDPDAAAGFRDVTVTNTDLQTTTRPQAFEVLSREFQIVKAVTLEPPEPSLIAYEPFVAVDPRNAMHAVVAYNAVPADTTGKAILQSSCAWEESQDGGRSWQTGLLRFPTGFRSLGDPWVRYTPDGRLFYSCIGATDYTTTNILFKTRTVGIFVAVSATGLATDLERANIVFKGQQGCRIDKLADLFHCSQIGLFTDHPSIGFINVNMRWRVIACWVDFISGTTGNTSVKVAYTDDGRTWSSPSTLAGGNVGACTVGGNGSQVGVAWWDKGKDATANNTLDDTLKLRLSIDGANWQKAVTPSPLGPLINGVSTTSRLLSVPYGLIFPSADGLKLVWQSGGDISQVFLGRPVTNAARTPIAAGVESFLPGASGCSDVIGAYVSTGATQMRYKTWILSASGSREIFTSRADSDTVYGSPDPSYPGLPRIGDYTGVDCAGDTAWAVWTELRNRKPEIWGAVLFLRR